MAVQKCTILMQCTTDPSNANDAGQHTGGWSESFWSETPIVPTNLFWNRLLQARAKLLPTQARIVGFRFSTYTIAGNRFLPGGSSTGRLNIPGGSGLVTDIPQVALMFAGSAVGAPNSSRFSIRCVPDDMVKRGEYQPNGAYRALVSDFCRELVDGGWCMLGRNLTLTTAAVVSVVPPVINVSAVLGAVVGTDSIRLLNVKDSQGNPISGAFRTVSLAGLAYTVVGLPDVTAGPGGAARVDTPVLLRFGSVEPNRIVARKIGSPFEKYVGKSSKRPA